MTIKTRQTMIAALFILFLFLPPMAGLLEVEEQPPLNEKRVRAPLPAMEFTLEALVQFPKQFEAYYNDHFGFRAPLIQGFNYLKVFWLHSSPTDSVLIGRNGWLFYWDRNSRDSYRRLNPWSPNTERLWKVYLRLMKAWLDSRTIQLLIIIPPDKGTIYPENMPATIYRSPSPSNLDRLVSLAEEVGMPIIDVRKKFQEAKIGKKLFFHYDTHWTSAGAYIAYRKLIEALIPYFPKINPIREGDLLIQETPYTSGKDLAVMLGLPHYFQEKGEHYDFHIPRKYSLPPLIPNEGTLETGRPDLPNAVLIRDSFGIALIPFLAQHFNKLTIAESQGLLPAILNRDRPSLVIIEMVERLLEQPDRVLGNVLDLLKSEQDINWIPAAELPRKVGVDIPNGESLGGIARKAFRRTTPPGTLMFGPYTELKRGDYIVRFRLRAGQGPRRGPITKIDVSADRGEKILAEKSLYAADFKNTERWQTFTLSFEVQSEKINGVEYRVEYFGGADLMVEGVWIIPKEKIGFFDKIYPLEED